MNTTLDESALRDRVASAHELTHISGRDAQGRVVEVQLAPDGSAAHNPAFDITPARLISALITERGTCDASVAALARMVGHAAP